MSLIQRGELSEGVRKRFRLSSDAAPDEVADAFSAVLTIENDRMENRAILGTRMVSMGGASGAGGVGNFNYFSLNNPFGSGILITVHGFTLIHENTLSAGNNKPLIVDLNAFDTAPVIGADLGATPTFMDTRLCMGGGGSQPFSQGRLFLQQAANIGGGAWRFMFRVREEGTGTGPWTLHAWPGSRHTQLGAQASFVLAPNTTMLLNPQGSDYTNCPSYVNIWYSERPMGELEGTFQQDSRHWIL